MQNQPGRRVTDSDLLGQLHSRDTLLVVAHAVDRPKPTAQRSPRLVKDSPSGNRALVSALGTFMHLACSHVAAARPAATRAFETLWPALPTQLLPALLLVAKPRPELPHRHHLPTRFAAGLLHTYNISPFIRRCKIDIHLSEMLRRQTGPRDC